MVYLQTNLLYTMNYPLISEYVEAIRLAEDNFEELSYLRPVLDAEGQPVMSSGNFAVVFKMRDERDGKLYAVRCFHRDQEGRAESYRLIEEGLKEVESPYLVSFRYMDKELFVDSSQTDETEFPVLLMDWVEGITLDKYLRENLDDQYALEMLAYRFSQLAQWLIPQPFAHGDLKPDNILVREDGTLVLVDYDGMYVPAMKGQKARELGSPDFRHPLRTENDFDEHIDDFPFVSILLSLKAISLNPQLLEEYGTTDRLLFSEKDYRDIANSAVLQLVLNQITNAEISRIYSLFVITLSEKRISEDSYTLVFKAGDKNNLFEGYKNISQFDSDSKYCLSCLLMNGFGCKQNVSAGIDLIAELAEQGHAQAQFKLGRYYETGEGLPQDVEKAMEWYTKAAEQGYAKAQHNWGRLLVLSHNYEEAVRWFTMAADQGLAPAQSALGRLHEQGKGVPQNYEKAVEWLTKAAKQGHAPAQTQLGYLYHKGLGVEQNEVESVEWFTKAAEQGYPHAQYCLGFHYMKGQGVPQSIEKANEWLIKAAEQGHVDAQKRLEQVTKEDLANAWTDEYGVTYSLDGKRLLRVEKTFDSEHYIIHDEVRVICNGAFQRCEIINNVTIHSDVKFIGENAFSSCKKLANITIPRNVIHIGDGAFSYSPNVRRIIVDANNPNYDSRDNCNAIIETLSNILIAGCKNTIIPKGVKTIGKSAFAFCEEMTEIEIPNGVTEIMDYAFYGCKSLRKVVLPNSIEKIGKEVFGSIVNIPNICISCGGKGKFEELLPEYKRCLHEENLGTEVTDEDIANAWVDADGVKYSIDRKRLLKAPNSLKGSDYIIKEGVCVICDGAFQSIGLHSITLPDSLLTIGRLAFANNDEMEYCNIPFSVKTICDNNPWGGCFNIKKMDCLSPLYRLENGILYSSDFQVLYGLIYWHSDIIIDSRTKIISGNAFWANREKWNTFIKELIISDAVKSIGDAAFYCCSGLTSIQIPEDVTSIGKSAFEGCSGLTSINIPVNVKSISSRTFKKCCNLKSVVIPDSVTEIGDFAFARCTNMNTVNIVGNIKSIGRAAFVDCVSLTLFKIPDSVTSIGECAFSGCNSLSSMIIPDNVISIGQVAFGKCGRLESITISNSATFINKNSFWECHGLKTIRIPKGSLQKFEDMLPYDMDKLEETAVGVLKK